MRKRNYYKIVSLFLLLGCNNNAINLEVDDNTSNAFQYLEGNWGYQNSIGYTSELILRKDSTFQFHDQTSYGQRWTVGRWIKNDNYIGLANYDKFVPRLKSNSDLKINKYSDTVPIYFNRIYLYLKEDTLFCADTTSYLKNFMFVKGFNRQALLNQK